MPRGKRLCENTILCKRNSNEIRCPSFFVLAKIQRNFATKFRQSAREVVESNEIRCHLGESSQLRKFALVKFPQSEILLAVEEGCAITVNLIVQ